MIQINEHFLKLKASYLFADIARRVSDFQKANPDKTIIKLGIGDVTEPLPSACLKAFHRAVDELGKRETFRGYPPYEGYDFLRNAIVETDFLQRGVTISPDEVFVSDGAKCDTGNIQELFSPETVLAIPDPVYPVYVDSNVMAGRTGAFEGGRYDGIVYLSSTPENQYLPRIPEESADLIYLCFPNNPTGAVATAEVLRKWVDYAKKCRAIILYDAAYVAFIRDASIPQSIFEIEGARDVAIEFRSYSKTAGFTGMRCGYAVVPRNLVARDSSGQEHSVHDLWFRRQTTKFNGVSYPVQRAAAAVYSPEGQEQVAGLTDFYLENARLIKDAVNDLGFSCVGGDHSPYIWIHTGGDSWAYFDLLLKKAGVVTTPGDGFGPCGAGHLRISAFNSRENVEKALQRIKTALA